MADGNAGIAGAGLGADRVGARPAPLGFLMFIAWRQLRPGLMPMWAGLPLGLFDDLFSGSPFGTAVLLWSLSTIVLDHVETRLPWRNFLTEWLVAIGLIVAYIVLCLGVSNIAGACAPSM
ncbi:rod shape-determining protein MreD [Novosphingobium resinovorum]